MYRYILALGLFFAAAFSAQAQEFKIGFVNIDRVGRDATMTKAAQAKFAQDFQKREKELLDADTALKAQAEKFDREAQTMAESQRTSRQRALVDQDRELQRKRRELQEDVNARRNEELQLFIEKVNKVIAQLAAAEKYDAIFQEAAYFNPKHDITDKVIKALNAQR